MATLEETLVPIYYYHRYQVEAVAKVLAGMDYNYAVRGDGQTVTDIVSPKRQQAAFNALLGTLQPDVLALEEGIIRLMAPRPPEYQRGRETFSSRTDPVFDPLVAAEAAASHSVGLILHPADWLPPIFVQRRIIGETVEIAADNGEGRTQFMRNITEQLHL